MTDINHFLLFFIVFLLALPQWCEGRQECELFNPPTPGIHCLRNQEAVEAVTRSNWAWVLLLYASWCGHCQRFAPHFKKLTKDLEAWSPVVRVGVFNCAESRMNYKICGEFGVESFPTIRVSLS